MANVLEKVNGILAAGGRVFEGLAMSSSMFQGDCEISRKVLSEDEMRDINSLQEHENFFSCVNQSHQATLSALKERFGISVAIPTETAPRVQLAPGDCLVVLGVVGLPRLTDRHQYTEEEIASAKFSFTLYIVK